MRMRSLALLALFTVLVTGLAVWAWEGAHRAEAAGGARGTPMFPALTATGSDPARIELAAGELRLTLERRDGSWLALQQGEFPMAAEPVHRLLAQLAELRRRETKTALPERYGVIGVEDPAPGATSRLIRIADAGGKVLAEALLGNTSRSIGARAAGGMFVRQPDEAQAWLVEGTVTVPPTLAEWIGPLLHVPATAVRTVSIRENTVEIFAAAKPAGHSVYRLQSASFSTGASEADDVAVKALAGSLVSLTAEDVRAAAEVTFAPEARTIVFETEAGMKISARLGDMDGETWVALEVAALPGSDVETEARAIAARTADWAFRLEERRTAALTTPVAELVAATAAGPQLPSITP